MEEPCRRRPELPFYSDLNSCLAASGVALLRFSLAAPAIVGNRADIAYAPPESKSDDVEFLGCEAKKRSFHLGVEKKLVSVRFQYRAYRHLGTLPFQRQLDHWVC
jgi:hypothetical protein